MCCRCVNLRIVYLVDMIPAVYTCAPWTAAFSHSMSRQSLLLLCGPVADVFTAVALDAGCSVRPCCFTITLRLLCREPTALRRQWCRVAIGSAHSRRRTPTRDRRQPFAIAPRRPRTRRPPPQPSPSPSASRSERPSPCCGPLCGARAALWSSPHGGIPVPCVLKQCAGVTDRLPPRRLRTALQIGWQRRQQQGRPVRRRHCRHRNCCHGGRGSCSGRCAPAHPHPRDGDACYFHRSSGQLYVSTCAPPERAQAFESDVGIRQLIPTQSPQMAYITNALLNVDRV